MATETAAGPVPARPDDETVTRRVRLARLVDDPVPWGLAGLALAVSATFVVLGLYYNRGALIAPLDDVYIHLQYGRQLGSGEGFAYNTGDPPSTGASSLLYVLVLGAAYAVGFTGSAFLAFAIALGALCTAATAALTCLAGLRIVGRTVGIGAGLLVAVSGPMAWGGVSGMEVGPAALLVVATVLAFATEAPARCFRVTPVVAALLALVRPEGLILAAVMVAAMGWTVRAEPARWRRAPWVALPLAAGAGQLLFYRLLTGSGEANGIQSKSLLNQQTLVQPIEAADAALRNLAVLVEALTGLGAQDLVPPATLVLAVIGLAAMARGRSSAGDAARRTLAVALGVGLVLVLLGVASLASALWHNLRYLQPFLPVVLLLAVIGLDAVVRHTGTARPRVLMGGLLAAAVLFTLVHTPAWGLRYAQQTATIREAPVSVAQWTATHLPPGSVVAVNDVGAAAYFSGHRVVDLVGLATNGFARPSNNGVGTLYEALRALPPDRRPTHFAIFERWGGVPVDDLRFSTVLGARPIATFELTSPVRDLSGYARPPCQMDRSCDVVNVWAADWTHADAGHGDRPDGPVPGLVRDHLDSGDLASEDGHGWSAQPPGPGVQPQSLVASEPRGDGGWTVDSGRHVVGGETFTLRNLTPGQPVTLTGRIAARGPRPEVETNTRSASVRVDGAPAGTWDFATDQLRPWQTSTFVVPGALVTGPEITVATGPRQALLAPYPDYVNFGVWASQ